MAEKPTYEELEQRVKELEEEAAQHKEAEKALRENEIEFRTLVERLPAITYCAALDESSTTLYVSPKIEEILGISQDKYKVDPDFWVKHLHDEDRERVLREVSLAHETSQPFISEYRMISTDGRIVWFRDEAVIVKDDEEIPLILQGIMFDITESKKAKEAIREVKESYDRITDNADEIIFRVDAKEGHVLYTNPAAERLLGYSLAEWLDDPALASKIIHPDFKEKREQVIEEVNATKKTIKNAVLGWIAKDGREIIVEYSVIPIVDKEDKIIYFESIGRDITERKQAEEKIKAYSENLELMVEERTKELEAKTSKLEEINIALNVLLKKREEDKIILQEQVLSNVKKLTLPYVEKLKKGIQNETHQVFIDVIESSLLEIVSPLSHNLSSDSFGLTPAEIKTADLIRQGRRTKEIAEMNNLSKKTIERHRESIRSKLGIKNKKINLQSHLNSLA
jgi:PAS domain S-box-containing protein